MSGGMLWGGRFAEAPAADLLRLTASVAVDLRLLPYDCRVTAAHARALAAAGLLGDDEVAAVARACEKLVEEWERGELRPDPRDEDVHSLVERELTARLGETGRRVHAGRSRNDLVAADFRLWCRDGAAALARAAARLCSVLARRAREHAETLMPGFTHLQPAQPVTVGFHLLAHGFAILRDARRFAAAGRAADVSPLGAGALAGTTLPLDPSVAASELSFGRTFDNAMDAVSDRDFAADLLYAVALTAVHLSRLGEEIVLWTSPAFSFARLPDAWSTGSSMMPQKRNPDLAELVRGRAAPAVGELGALLALVKGLPLAYDRDLQEDKELVFRGVDRALGSLTGVAAMVEGLSFDTEALERAVAAGEMWATDLAEVLVGRGVPFREAHEAVGRLVAEVAGRGGVPDDDVLRRAHPSLRPGDAARLAPAAAVAARRGPGGPAPERVREQCDALDRAATAFPDSDAGAPAR